MLGRVWGLDPQTLLSLWNLPLLVLKINLTQPDFSSRQDCPARSSLKPVSS